MAFLVILARRDVARGDPAPGPAAFDSLADGQGLLPVGSRIADEDGALQRLVATRDRVRFVHGTIPAGKPKMYGDAREMRRN